MKQTPFFLSSLLGLQRGLHKTPLVTLLWPLPGTSHWLQRTVTSLLSHVINVNINDHIITYDDDKLYPRVVTSGSVQGRVDPGRTGLF